VTVRSRTRRSGAEGMGFRSEGLLRQA
jgi:hypothetical protein